jgi:hypothetical protein
LLAQIARVWWMRTKHPLSAVLADGYFDTLTDDGNLYYLRRRSQQSRLTKKYLPPSSHGAS